MIGFHGKNIMNGKRTGQNMKTKASGQFNPSINRLLSFILSISILLTVAAPFAEPQTVDANWVTNTIGGLIASLVINSGAANIDPSYTSYLNDPNNSVMSIQIENQPEISSLPSDLAQQIDTAIASAPQSVQRTVSQLATTQADIVYLDEYLKDNGVSSGVPQELQPATVGQNVAASAHNLEQTGYVEQSIGGFANAWLMNRLGPIINDFGTVVNTNQQYQMDMLDLWAQGKITEAEYNEAMNASNNERHQYYQSIASGSNINTSDTLLNLINDGDVGCVYQVSRNGSITYVTCPNSCILYLVENDNGYMIINCYNPTSTVKTLYTKRSDGTIINALNVQSRSKPGLQVTRQSEFYNINIGLRFSNRSLANSYIDTYGNDYKVYSPSLIGSDGQLSANLNIDPTLNVNYYTTNQAPIYNYNNYKMEPINLNDYINFASSITQQIGNGASQESISEAVQEYLQEYLVEYQAPVPTVAPVVPDQPNPNPKPTGTPEQQAENEEIMATPELKDKFPFCIPWDIYYAFAVLEDQREAPSLDFDLDLGPAGIHHIEIDFSEWEDIASLLRLLELLAFIIGLAIATKHLMGGTAA